MENFTPNPQEADKTPHESPQNVFLSMFQYEEEVPKLNCESDGKALIMKHKTNYTYVVKIS